MTEELGNTQLRIYGDETYKLHFYGGLLTVYRVTQENDEEVLTPTLVQPWKTIPNGTRQSFKDVSDAFDWFDSYMNR